MITAALDQTKLEAFQERILDTLNAGATALMVSIGHRTGLFDVLAESPPSSSDELARTAGLNERYVREWLAAMACAGIVDYDVGEETFSLPPEHAACLTRAATPNNLAVFGQHVACLGTVEDEVIAAFHDGRGVPYSAYKRFHTIMAEDSEQSVVAALLDHILPLEPGLIDRLAHGIRVADVGCGRGKAMLLLAQVFPASRFLGFDIAAEAIAAANAETADRSLDNVRFIVHDAAEPLEPETYDLITTFDAVHDQGDPAAVLRNIHDALAPGGVYLMQDILASSRLSDNLAHPLAPFLYTVSCMHCMSVSLAAGGPGLGTMWGRETALRMLREAGFRRTRVETLPHDLMNYYYISPRLE